MKFKRALTIATGLLALASHAQADNFFVANSGINSITKYDDNGGGSPFTGAFVNGPYGLALDSSGNLYVTTNSNVIRKFGPDGVDLGVFASTGINFAMGLAFDAMGNLYAANFGGNTSRSSPRMAPTSAFSRSSSVRPAWPSMPRATFTLRISGTRSSAFRPSGHRSSPLPASL